ncbi:hypothetical protein NQZ68_001017 [Dissostichus eleginoides]|nr:hypothetical protein NQZ68_001017 [Dissostichus eleginoides]
MNGENKAEQAKLSTARHRCRVIVTCSITLKHLSSETSAVRFCKFREGEEAWQGMTEIEQTLEDLFSGSHKATACQCPAQFEGPECQQNKHSFHGNGYAWFPPMMPCFESHVSLEFITDVADGLLLYSGPLAQLQAWDPEDFMALELIDGTPTLKINHGSGTVVLQLPGNVNVADRRWHRLDVRSNSKLISNSTNPTIYSKNGSSLKAVNGFKSLGSYILDFGKDSLSESQSLGSMQNNGHGVRRNEIQFVCYNHRAEILSTALRTAPLMLDSIITSTDDKPTSCAGYEIYPAGLSEPYWKPIPTWTRTTREVRFTLDRCSGAAVMEMEGLGSWLTTEDHSSCEVTGVTPNTDRHLNMSQVLQLGGVNEDIPYVYPQLQHKHFSGCIRNLIVDSKLYDLGSPADSNSSSPGCLTTDSSCVNMGYPSCGHRGRCHGEWGSFSCQCVPGYAGHQCEEVETMMGSLMTLLHRPFYTSSRLSQTPPEMLSDDCSTLCQAFQACLVLALYRRVTLQVPEYSFDGHSHAHFQLPSTLPARRTWVQVLVRTRKHSSTILNLISKEQSEYIRLEIFQGLLCVFYNLGDGDYNLTLPTYRLDNGEWHEVFLDRHDNEMMLRLDGGGGQREVTGAQGRSREIIIDPTVVMLGNTFPSGTNKSFQGCMRDVRLNGRYMPLDSQPRDGVSQVSVQGVSLGCSSDSCKRNQCSPPFTCVDLWRVHECRCPPGHMIRVNVTRKSCVYTLCATRPCHRGTCVAQSPSKFTCHCPEGYRGRHCETTLAIYREDVGLSFSSLFAICICFMALLGDVSCQVYMEMFLLHYEGWHIQQILPELITSSLNGLRGKQLPQFSLRGANKQKEGSNSPGAALKKDGCYDE